MIDLNILSGLGITVVHSLTSSSYTSSNTSSNNVFTGTIHYNYNNKTLEVFNGMNWDPIIPGTAIIGLEPKIHNWILNKITEEQKWIDMAKKFPSIQNALNNLKEAEEQLKIMAILCEDQK